MGSKDKNSSTRHGSKGEREINSDDQSESIANKALAGLQKGKLATQIPIIQQGPIEQKDPEQHERLLQRSQTTIRTMQRDAVRAGNDKREGAGQSCVIVLSNKYDPLLYMNGG